MAYSDLIKNFEKTRDYMRQFYVYGFKSRMEYGQRSPRSYDDERRRVESWLGDYMYFTRSAEGKNVFLSLDSRAVPHNPFYKAWKAKSFTDGDITLHFIIFDILSDSSVSKSLHELIDIIEEDYLSHFEEPMSFDESTLRKKLKEYESEGIILSEKRGRQTVYKRNCDFDIAPLYDLLSFYSEVAPCGVIGSYMLDKSNDNGSIFTFKHHYITSALDSDVLVTVFSAMGEGRGISFKNRSTEIEEAMPIKVLISVQNGRQHVVIYDRKSDRFFSYRADYMSDVKIEKTEYDVNSLREKFSEIEKYMWGVSCSFPLCGPESVSFTVRVSDEEEYIIDRLEREKRCGTVEEIDEGLYRFYAEVCDSHEMIPWIRTFICRITSFEMSNKEVEKVFKDDLQKMYRMYETGCE